MAETQVSKKACQDIRDSKSPSHPSAGALELKERGNFSRKYADPKEAKNEQAALSPAELIRARSGISIELSPNLLFQNRLQIAKLLNTQVTKGSPAEPSAAVGDVVSGYVLDGNRFFFDKNHSGMEDLQKLSSLLNDKNVKRLHLIVQWPKKITGGTWLGIPREVEFALK